MSHTLTPEMEEALANRPKVDISWLQISPKRKVCNSKRVTEKKRNVGRPALKDLYPSVVNVARSFVENNGFRAHRRRQEETGTCGSTLKQVKHHLLQTIPELKSERPSIGMYQNL